MLFRLIRSTVALGAAGATGAATAYYLTDTARGTTRGAPGYTKALATIGKQAGGSMPEGMAIIGASAALSGAMVYQILAPGPKPAAETSESDNDVTDELIAEAEEILEEGSN